MLHQWQNVKDIRFSADGNSVGLLRNDGQLELADVKSHDATTLFEHKVRCFTFSPCDDFIAVAVPAGKILRWDYQTNEVSELCSLKRSPSKLVFSPSGDVFALEHHSALSDWICNSPAMSASLVILRLLRDAEQMTGSPNEQLVVHWCRCRIDSFADRIRCNDFKLLGVLDHHGGAAAAGQIDVSARCDR